METLGFFVGNIIDGKMHLSPIGEIALAEWEKSFDIRPNLFCDAFVIMPNHIHAILRIDNDRDAQLCVCTLGLPFCRHAPPKKVYLSKRAP